MDSAFELGKHTPTKLIEITNSLKNDKYDSTRKTLNKIKSFVLKKDALNLHFANNITTTVYN